MSESRSVVSDSLRRHGLYSPWNSPGQNTGVGSHSLPQGIFPTQGLNPGLLHCRRILYQLNHKESPRTRKWVAHLFSSGSFWPRNQTGVSCIAGGLYQLRYRGSPVADEETLINSLLISLILYMGKLKDRQNKKWPQRSLILRSLQTGLSSQSVWLQSLTLPSPLSSPSALPCF